ncbi:MAG: hypothetical protein OXR73_29430 [Myxococcales bacterium]|nr:hypothetical protein [Myxococcales bacterium]
MQRVHLVVQSPAQLLRSFLIITLALGCGKSFAVTSDEDTSVAEGRSARARGRSSDATGARGATKAAIEDSEAAVDAGSEQRAAVDAGPEQRAANNTANAEAPESLERFSFFVTSLEIMRELSGSADGFGGDLGGIEGADRICQEAAARVGFGDKTWRAFLSVTDGGDGNPIHAIDRIGEGPWYDRNGRLVSEDKAGLLAGDRPAGDAQTINDLPNEFGEGLKMMGDTHDILTGSNAMGMLDSPEPENTCNNWTSTTVMPIGGGFGLPDGFDFEDLFAGFGSRDGGVGFGGRPGGLRVGHSWPAISGQNWIASHSETSCAAGVNLVQNGPGDGSSVGAGGGWGAFYCFALTP